MITIVIPARNESETIAEAIAQFRNLSMPHEIIVSDDASTDNTVEIARRLADRVITFQGDRRVIARVRNAGAAHARGDILVFADADSRLPDPEGYLRHAIGRFEREGELVGIATPQRVQPAIERVSSKVVFVLDNLYVRLISNVFRQGGGCGKLMFVRKSAFDRAGGFDESLIFREDADLMRRLTKFGRTHFDSALTVYHSGRRLHRLGLLRFWMGWWLNGLSVHIRGKAWDREWKALR